MPSRQIFILCLTNDPGLCLKAHYTAQQQCSSVSQNLQMNVDSSMKPLCDRSTAEGTVHQQTSLLVSPSVMHPPPHSFVMFDVPAAIRILSKDSFS